MNLYELSEQARQLYELLESGEIDETILLDNLAEIGVNATLEDFVYSGKSMDYDISVIDAELARLKEKKRILENRRKYCDQQIIRLMQTAGQKAVNAGTFRITMRENKSCEITDETAIPEKYKREIPAKFEPDKAAMLKALKAGEQISGASLKTNYSVTAK